MKIGIKKKTILALYLHETPFFFVILMLFLKKKK